MLSFPHFLFAGFSLSLGAASAQTLSELSLPEAATKALAAHPSIAANRAQTQSAKEKVAEAHAARWFRVDYTESFSRSDNPVFVFGGLLTQRQFSESNFAIGTLNRPNFLNNSQSLVSIDQPIWDAGRARYAEAGLHGISEETISRTLRLAANGEAAGALHLDREQDAVPIVLRLPRWNVAIWEAYSA